MHFMAIKKIGEKASLISIYSYLKDGSFSAVTGVQRSKLARERGTLKIEKICFSPKVPIQPCRAKPVFSLFWSLLSTNQKAIATPFQPLSPNQP